MAMYIFGSGTLWGTRSDIPNATPQKFGALNDVSVEFSASSKHLYGQNQFPLAVARGTGKISGKAKFAQIQGRIYTDLFFGAQLQSGQVATANGEAAAVPAVGPYQVSVLNAATWSADLGVVNAATGLTLHKVASSPAEGQYSVSSTGLYSFNAADSGMALLISYRYGVAGSGQSFTVVNQQLGTQPVFSVTLETVYNAPGGLKKAVLTLNACVSNKLNLATKTDDFAVSEIDFDCFADAAGNVFTWSFNEVS